MTITSPLELCVFSNQGAFNASRVSGRYSIFTLNSADAETVQNVSHWMQYYEARFRWVANSGGTRMLKLGEEFKPLPFPSHLFPSSPFLSPSTCFFLIPFLSFFFWRVLRYLPSHHGTAPDYRAGICLNIAFNNFQNGNRPPCAILVFKH